MLNTLINPQSIAIIGASEDTAKPGGKILQNILANGYEGQLLTVNLKLPQVQGVAAYPTVSALPVIPELAFIAIPAKIVQQALLDLADKGTKVVVVLSAGFGEANAAGKQAEEKLAQIADAHGILLLGPNCSGIVSYAHASKFTGFIPGMSRQGIDFISGSGAMVDFLTEQAARRGILFHSLVTVGNSAQSGVTEVLGLFDTAYDEGSPPIKLVYMESVHDPQAFLKHGRSLSRQGCLLAGIKSGTTRAGSRAAASHTGAMVTNDTAVQALFDKTGMIRVHSRLDLVEVAAALVCARGKVDGRRVCVISDAGGPGVMVADELSRWGLQLPRLQASTQARIAEILPPGAGVINPIDCLPTRTSGMIAQLFTLINEEEAANIDYIFLIMGDSGLTKIEEMYAVVQEAMATSSIPIFPTFCSVLSTVAALQRFRAMGNCYFEDEVALARALGRIVNRPRLTEPETTLANYNDAAIKSKIPAQTGPLSATATREILTAVGLHFPAQHEFTNISELNQVGFDFPWVMKVMGPLHKSDVGGVRLGVRSLAEARYAWEELQEIEGATGCLIQQMVSGPEVLLGAKREEEYGHLLAFGLGGIYTEALRDVQFNLAPLSLPEAEKMIRSIHGFSLLGGLRGQPGLDVDRLADWLIRIGRLVTDFPQIEEMDLNPVKGNGQDLYVVDARLIIS